MKSQNSFRNTVTKLFTVSYTLILNININIELHNFKTHNDKKVFCYRFISWRFCLRVIIN